MSFDYSSSGVFRPRLGGWRRVLDVDVRFLANTRVPKETPCIDISAVVPYRDFSILIPHHELVMG